ncbi:MAG: hypothetical protein ABI606_01210 [Rhodoferax sp.]
MSLSSATLSAIQQAGAAIFAADAELKNAVKAYGERINGAMVSNPYGLGNDALFENWKVVARLSQTVAGIEEELKKVFSVASDLTDDDSLTVTEVPALAAPTRSVDSGMNSQDAMTPTDVVVKTKKTKKTKKNTASPKKRVPKARVAAKASRVKSAIASGSQLAPSGNPAKLLQHLERILNPDEFTVIHQSAISLEIGIPLGSMTAATRKLMESGRIIAGQSGSFKLASNAPAQA